MHADTTIVRAVRRRVADFVAGGLFERGERPLLMLSGGPDSMALLDLVAWVSGRLGLDLRPAALHVDYRTRGAGSTRDRRLVERSCRRAGVPLHVEELAGKPAGGDFQNRARRIRYQAARRLVADGEADVIVTAHNRDDQAETVLYRLTKYASPGALAAMRPREGDLARPLLCLGADEIRAYCGARGLAFGVDESNATTVYARNLLRHEVLPVLARLNPRVVQTLADVADLAAATNEIVAAAIDEAWGRVATVDAATGASVLDVVALAAEAEGLRALCLRRLISEALGPEALVERRVTAAVERLAATTDGSASVTLSRGLEAVREYEALRVRRRAGTHACPPVALVPGRAVEFCGRRFVSEVLEGAQWAPAAHEAYLALPDPPTALVLRHPRRGERFRPLGASEATLVSGFLSATKVPRGERGTAVVAEIDGEVAWVCPGRISESYRVSKGTRQTLHIVQEEP